MMKRALLGLETEYGLAIEGRGPHDQIQDAQAFVEACACPAFVGWDYRDESPRRDLRGFSVDRLAVDPLDMQFESDQVLPPAHVLRADRVLTTGARFYNDHGHPEYATAERACPWAVARDDALGEDLLRETAEAYRAASGQSVSIYKNNTDFHGASYGTHESVLVPREVGFERLFAGVLPMLIARIVLCGAGKVGHEHGRAASFQISQRADFFAEAANVETLYRRPIFNTRDEPHAEPTQWIRLHVIAGDANRNPRVTARKLFLLSLATRLTAASEGPIMHIHEPVRAIEALSKDSSLEFEVPLESGKRTTAIAILEEYLHRSESALDLESVERDEIESIRDLLLQLRVDPDRARRQLDWAAKRYLVELYDEPDLRARQAVDLAYSCIYGGEDLYTAMVEAGEIDAALPEVPEIPTRASVRGLAVARFASELKSVNWRWLTWADGRRTELLPEAVIPPNLADARDVDTFIELLETQ